jgi:hypothetical protein
VTPAAIVLAVAVAAWGAIVPVPELPPPAVARPVTPAGPAAVGLAPSSPRAASASPAPAPPATMQLPIIAKAPVDVRAGPALVAAPRARPEPRPRSPLYKDWRFWVISGGLFAAAVIFTIAETRPGPEPYTGNAPPYFIGFP